MRHFYFQKIIEKQFGAFVYVVTATEPKHFAPFSHIIKINGIFQSQC